MRFRRRRPRFCVVVPASNAEATIADTLRSVAEQSFGSWEAVVVDDGSRDATRSIVERFAASDERVRVRSGEWQNVASARNAGLADATAEWVLLLDADDTIAPRTFEVVAGALGDDRDLDGVVYGTVRIRDDEKVIDHHHWEDSGDRFAAASRYCPFPIHACVVRRSLVEALGAFDPSVARASDWDLWQRVIRAGARLRRLGDVLARYRIHPPSMSGNATAMFRTALEVLDRCHAPDPRVEAPVPAYALGRPARHRPAAVLRHVCWSAGVALAHGQDLAALLAIAEEDLGRGHGGEIEPIVAATGLEETFVRLASPRDEVWAKVGEVVLAFLERFEVLAEQPGLARRTELLVSPESARGEGRARAAAPADPYTVDVELSRPLSGVRVSSDVDRVVVVGRIAGRAVGLLDLDVRDGVIGTDELRDAAAERWSWQICAYQLEGLGRIEPSADPGRIWHALVRESAHPGAGPIEDTDLWMAAMRRALHGSRSA